MNYQTLSKNNKNHTGKGEGSVIKVLFMQVRKSTGGSNPQNAGRLYLQPQEEQATPG